MIGGQRQFSILSRNIAGLMRDVVSKLAVQDPGASRETHDKLVLKLALEVWIRRGFVLSAVV